MKLSFLILSSILIAVMASQSVYAGDHRRYDDDRAVRRGSVDDRRHNYHRERRHDGKRYHRSRRSHHDRYYDDRRRHHYHAKRPRRHYWRNHHGDCFRVELSLDGYAYIGVPIGHCH